MRRILAAVCVVAALGACGIPRDALHEGTSLLLLSSLKGTIFPSGSDDARTGGVSLIAGISKQLHKESNLVVVAANGTLSGSPESFFTQGGAMVQALNGLGLDALVLDARDFNFGAKRLEALAGLASFPFLAANLRDASGNIPSWTHPYWKSADGKTAVIGLAGPYTLSRNFEIYVKGLSLVEPMDAVRSALNELQSTGKVEHVVVVAVGYKTSAEKSHLLEELAGLQGIELVVRGDVTGNLAGPILEGSSAFIGVDDSKTDGGVQVAHVFGQQHGVELLPVSSTRYEPDDSLRSLMYSLRVSTGDLLNRTVTSLARPLPHRDDEESALGDFITDAMRSIAGAEIAVLNSGALRKGLPSHLISVRDVYEALPFGGNLMLGKLRGSALLAILDRSFSFIGHPEKGRGFLQVSGIEVRGRPAAPEGRRVFPQDVRIHGVQLDPDKDYLVVSDRYLIGLGDGYVEFGAWQPIKSWTESTTDLLIQELEKEYSWQLSDNVRIRVIRE